MNQRRTTLAATFAALAVATSLTIAERGDAATIFGFNFDGVNNNGVGEVEAWGNASSPSATVAVSYDAAGNVASHDVVEDATNTENGDVFVNGGDPAAANGSVTFRLLAQKSVDKAAGPTRGDSLVTGTIDDGGNGALGVGANPGGGGIASTGTLGLGVAEGFILQMDTSGLASTRFVRINSISVTNFATQDEAVRLVNMTDPARGSVIVTVTDATTTPVTLSGPGTVVAASGNQPETVLADVSSLNATVLGGSIGHVNALTFFHAGGIDGFRLTNLSYSIGAIPEPSSAMLALAGISAVVWGRRALAGR